MERFPLELEVKWKDYNRTTYEQLFKARFGVPVTAGFGEKIQAQIAQEMLEYDGQYLRATAKGYEILNTVLVDLMP